MMCISALPCMTHSGISAVSHDVKPQEVGQTSTIIFNQRNLKFFPFGEFEWSGMWDLQIFNPSLWIWCGETWVHLGRVMQYFTESMFCCLGYDALISSEDNKQKQRDYALSHWQINKILPLSLLFIFRVEESTDCLLHKSTRAPRVVRLFSHRAATFKQKQSLSRFHCMCATAHPARLAVDDRNPNFQT